MADASFFLGRETVIASKHLGMSTWRAKVFAIMFRNALRASAFFHIPHDRVIELGVEVEI
jgi:KUP system potassium uptake protein